MKVYFAADHAGFALKAMLMEYVSSRGYGVEDVGAYELNMEDDYPPYVAKAVRAVAESPDGSRAIVIGGSGQGEAMVANRFQGVRAAVYYGGGREQSDATGKTFDVVASSRVHNDANVLAIGARFVSEDEATRAVDTWLETPFTGESRHVRRIAQIDEHAADSHT